MVEVREHRLVEVESLVLVLVGDVADRCLSHPATESSKDSKDTGRSSATFRRWHSVTKALGDEIVGQRQGAMGHPIGQRTN